MKILILGANGMLGHDLVEVFHEHSPVAWGKEALDITDNAMVQRQISLLHPDIIINAAAYTDVDGCETNRTYAFKVNGDALSNLASVATMIKATLVHVSTDYVFDGKNAEGYKEDDPPHPINCYGESKEQGEKLLISGTSRYFLIRSSWLYGTYGKNFVKTIVKRGEEQDEIHVVDDQRGCPTYTKDLASGIKQLLMQQYPYGIYHMTNQGNCTWYEFAQEIKRITHIKAKVIPITSKELKRTAQRPGCSILLNTKTKIMLRSWKKALEAYLEGSHLGKEQGDEDKPMRSKPMKISRFR